MKKRKRRGSAEPGVVKLTMVSHDGPRPSYLEDQLTECWICTGALQGNGYRMINGRPAHRYAYEQVHGEVPRGFQVHHMCLRRDCINPDHMIVVSPKDHARIHSFLRGQQKRAA